MATVFSIPVPTIGFSGLSIGTACLCMLDPISALFASSCSRNGINAAATDTTCLGDTSINCTFSGEEIINSLLFLQEIKSPTILLFLSNSVFA